MKKYILLLLVLVGVSMFASSQDKSVILKLYHTTDVHGNFFSVRFHQ